MVADPRDRTLEGAVVAAFPWLIGALAVSAVLLFVPRGADRRWELLIHLSMLVVLSLLITWVTAPHGDRTWFGGRGWSPLRRYLATATALIVIATGVTGLVTLASSAAMQYQPSLQFLQLLSALDIAWVVAGTTIALRSLWGNVAAAAGGIMMSILCVLSIALYLVEVGLSPDQGWLLDGTQMLRLVLPFDVAAALITITLLMLAARAASSDSARKSPVV